MAGSSNRVFVDNHGDPLGPGDNTLGRVKITDGVDVADVLDLASANPLAVAILDGSGDQITSFGGGTQYTEDAAAAANPVGTVPILVRVDTPAGAVTTDGDNVAQRGTNYGAAYVTLLDTGGSPVAIGGGTQYTEDAAAAVNPIGTALNLVRDDARAGGLTSLDGDNVAARGTNAGELYVKHVDTIAVTQSGTWDEVGINDSGNSITVDNPQLSVVGGGTEATALRVTLASDSTGLLSVDDNGGSLTIDNAQLSVVGGGIEATALRVTLANDSTGVVSVDDNGASLTVDNAHLTSLGGAIAGTEVQVDVVAALPAGTNAIGKLAANSGVDIGDVDVTSMVSGDFEHFSNLDVDTAAEQLTAFACKFGVTIKADKDNTSAIYVGKSDVTAGTTDATDGFKLDPGDAITLPVSNSNLLYVIGGANNQKVFVVAV